MSIEDVEFIIFVPAQVIFPFYFANINIFFFQNNPQHNMTQLNCKLYHSSVSM